MTKPSYTEKDFETPYHECKNYYYDLEALYKCGVAVDVYDTSRGIAVRLTLPHNGINLETRPK